MCVIKNKSNNFNGTASDSKLFDAVSSLSKSDTFSIFSDAISIINDPSNLNQFLFDTIKPSNSIANLSDVLVSIKRKDYLNSVAPNSESYTQEEQYLKTNSEAARILGLMDNTNGDFTMPLISDMIIYNMKNNPLVAIDARIMANLSAMYTSINYPIYSKAGFRDDLVMQNEDDDYYQNQSTGEKYIRASSILDNLFEMKTIQERIDESNKKIESNFKEVEEEFTKFGTIKSGYKVDIISGKAVVKVLSGNKAYGIKEYKEFNEKNKRIATVKGRLFHAYIEKHLLIGKIEAIKNIEKDDQTQSKMIAELNTRLLLVDSKISKYSNSVGKDSLDVEKSSELFIENKLREIAPELYHVDINGDYIQNRKSKAWLNIETEKTIAVDDKYDYNLDSYDGIASSIDFIIGKEYEGKMVYKIIDAKSSISDESDGPLIKGTEYKRNRATLNKFKLVLNAIMLKASDPNASIEELVLASIDSSNNQLTQSIDLMPELGPILSILKKEISKENPTFVNNNLSLFEVDSYVTEPELLRDKRIELIQSDPVKYTDKKALKEDLLYFVEDSIKKLSISIKDKIKFNNRSEVEDENKKLEKLIESKAYLTAGKRYLKNTDISWRQRNMTHASQSDNQFIQLFYRAYEIANQTLNSYLMKESKALTKLFKESFPNAEVSTLLNGSYKDRYGWMMKEKLVPSKNSNNPDYRMQFFRTFKDINDWTTLVNEDKSKAILLDELRFKFRYKLFEVMAPSQGVKFIEDEIAIRNNPNSSTPFLDNNHLKLLLNQIEMLKSKKDYNKNLFKSEDHFKKQGFIYEEGWFPKYRVTKDSNSSIGRTYKNVSKNVKQGIDDIFGDNLDSWMDDKFMSKNESNLPDQGLVVNWFNRINEESEGKNDMSLFDNEYSYNAPQSIFEFLYSMERKRTYDEVYFLGVGISTLFEAKDLLSSINDSKKNKALLEFLNNQILVNIRGQKMRNAGTASTAIGDVDLDKVTSSLTGLARSIVMGFEVVGGIASSIPATIILIKRSLIDNYILKMVGGTIKGTGKFTYDTNDAGLLYLEGLAYATMAQIPFMLNKIKILRNLGIGKSETEFTEKLALLSKKFVFKSDDIQELIEDNDFNIQPFISADNLKGAAFYSYKVIDNINYNAVLYATLKSMKIKGTEKSMWDAYIVKDGEVEWDENLPARGVDSDTGEELKGLNANEVQSLKFMTTKFMGSMRPEEKTSMDSNTIMGLLSTFKRYIPGISDSLLAARNEESSLGYYVETGQIDEIGLPKFKWVAETDQGSLRMVADIGAFIPLAKLGSLVHLSRLAEYDKTGYRDYWNALSRQQKKSLVGYMTNVLTSIAVLILMADVFDDDDDDPIAKFVKKANNGMQSFIDPQGIASYASIPVLDILTKVFKTFFTSPAKDIITEGELSDRTQDQMLSYVPLYELTEEE